jgi:CHASE3 domain sensor protein
MDRKNRAGGAGLNRVMLAIAALVLIAIVGISYRQWRQYNRINGAGVASRQIIESVDALQSSLTEAETGQRGFLLTGEAQYLEPYNQALQRIPNELSTLRRQLANGTSESANLAQLENLAGQKLAELRQTIDLRRSQGAAPAMAVVFSDRGKQIMDEIRSLSGQIKTAESTAQSEGSLAGMAASQTALLVTIAGSLVILILFGIGFELS